MLILQPNQFEMMSTHAERTYPEECCGLLLGVAKPETDRRLVYEVRSLENQWTTTLNPFAETDRDSSRVSKANRYWVDPRALLTAQREGRDRGWIILGVYHSHPDYPAHPSERDRQLAWAEYSYPILSVMDGQVIACLSWRLDQNGQFQPEKVHIERWPQIGEKVKEAGDRP